MKNDLLSKIGYRSSLAIVLSVVLITLFQNCGVERPRVEEASYRSTTFTPESHQKLAAGTQCSTCHESARPLTKTASHNFSHLDPQWVAQDCVLCHTQKERWGVSWVGGQFAHHPIPNTCIECHQSYKPTSTVFIANDSTRPFNHTGSSECATCHVNTSKFDSIADWRPATAEPNGLVGSKTFSTQIIKVTFNGPSVVRAPAQAQSFKLEIDHNHDLVSNLACTTCHGATSSSGNFKGALFHANITANPTACVECHKNARPVGAVGSKGLMIHDAVQWDSSAIGTVIRGTTPMVQAECATCHLNTSTMPSAGSPPPINSQPFKQANFHFNTSSGVSSCLDCHAQSRPQGSAGFSDVTWKNKTNTGGPPFTTFNLNTHAPNVDCATCHNAPSAATTSAMDWAPGYFLHSASNLNCLNCHTATGITSQNHTGFNSNCVSCHVGAASQFPNPTIADWKNGVISGAPSGLVGDRTIQNAIKCNGVLGSTPNCTASNPNIIPKGYNHTINTKAVACQNCHGAGVSSAANGKFHTPPLGVTNWIAPAAGDISSCNNCHDPTVIPISLVSVKSLGIIGSQVNVSAGATPFAGVNHNHSLVAGKTCVQCHTAPTNTVSSTWNQATKIHTQFTPNQVTTCSECHYKRMPSGVIARKNQTTYKGVSKQQNFTHTSTVSLPTLAAQQCSTCHTSSGGTWTAAGSVSFHNKVTVTNNCNLCHQAPGGVVTSSTSGVSYNHDLVANLGDCATCHGPSISKVNGRIPAVSDWDGGAGAPSTYTIPSHTTGGYTVPGYIGTHTTNPSCISCHGTGDYKVITDFDHQGLPSNSNTCVSCHLGTKADVSAYIASTSPIDMSSNGSSRHHPSSIFKGKNTSCVGCHTMSARANTFNNLNGVVIPAVAKDAYVNVGCGSVSGSTFSCHEDNQRSMTVPSTTTGSGSWDGGN